MRALLAYPTYDHGKEVMKQYLAGGINAACYPGRTTEDSETMDQNCWSEIAGHAEFIGFPVVRTVCPGCEHRKKCQESGYLGQLRIVKEADVAICTHKRAEYAGLGEMVSSRQFLAIHENFIDVLRPKMSITVPDLIQATYVLGQVLNDPRFLDRFGDALRVDDNGNLYEDEELAIRRDRQYEFCRLLADMFDQLLAALHSAEKTIEWRPESVLKRPQGIERMLFFATRTTGASFKRPAWRFILSATSGELCSAAIIVEQKSKKRGKGVVHAKKSAIGVRNNVHPPTVTNWFNDATSTVDRLEMILGDGLLQDETPQGYLPLKKKAVQILRDVTRRTSPKTVANVICGVMADRPQFHRIGIICHNPHMSALKTLGSEFESRIAKSTYFGSGEDRSSNEWHQQCDLLIIVGTPRVPPRAVAEYLVQVDEVGAACRQPQWGVVYWRGETESGEPVKVKSSGYRDEAWRRAHRDLVRARIVQAVGRGRGILKTGCEVIVLSNEECGLVISDVGMEALNGGSAKVLEALRQLTAENANIYYLGKTAVSTRKIAQTISIKPRRVRELLSSLERRGLVRRVGERSGWLPVIPATEEAAPCADMQLG